MWSRRDYSRQSPAVRLFIDQAVHATTPDLPRVPRENRARARRRQFPRDRNIHAFASLGSEFAPSPRLSWRPLVRVNGLTTELPAKPRLGQAQIVTDDVNGLAEGLGRLFRGHSSEVPHFNQLG